MCLSRSVQQSMCGNFNVVLLVFDSSSIPIRFTATKEWNRKRKKKQMANKYTCIGHRYEKYLSENGWIRRRPEESKKKNEKNISCMNHFNCSRFHRMPSCVTTISRFKCVFHSFCLFVILYSVWFYGSLIFHHAEHTWRVKIILQNRSIFV